MAKVSKVSKVSLEIYKYNRKMPIKKSDYPANWATEIVPAVLHRAGEVRQDGIIVEEAHCEWCLVRNHCWVRREKKLKQVRLVEYAGVWKIVPALDFVLAEPKQQGAVYIILSTAHLDRNRENNKMDNLASLCQRCHLNHDRKAQHIPNRAYGKYHDQQPKLF